MGAKLIRDKMKDLPWRHEGAKRDVRPVQDLDEHVALLVRKILEEVGELISVKDRAELREEAIDVLEAVYALCELTGIGEEEVHNARWIKFKEKGSFVEGWVWET